MSHFLNHFTCSHLASHLVCCMFSDLVSSHLFYFHLCWSVSFLASHLILFHLIVVSIFNSPYCQLSSTRSLFSYLESLSNSVILSHLWQLHILSLSLTSARRTWSHLISFNLMISFHKLSCQTHIVKSCIFSILIKKNLTEQNPWCADYSSLSNHFVFPNPLSQQSGFSSG